MKTIFISIMSLAAIVFGGSDRLSGRWQSKPSEKGNVTSVSFMPDNTFEGYINRKPFVTGKYEIKGDVFTFTDNGCNGLVGTYKMIFFAANDSLRFETVTDSCQQRRAGMEKLILGRVLQ